LELDLSKLRKFFLDPRFFAGALVGLALGYAVIFYPLYLIGGLVGLGFILVWFRKELLGTGKSKKKGPESFSKSDTD